MPHYDLIHGKFAEVPPRPSDEKRIAESRALSKGFERALRFTELLGHPFELPSDAGFTTLAAIYARTLRVGEESGVGNIRFKHTTLGSVAVFASDSPQRNSVAELSLHDDRDVSRLLAVTYDLQHGVVQVDSGEVVDLSALPDATEDTSKLIAQKAAEFFASVERTLGS